MTGAVIPFPGNPRPAQRQAANALIVIMPRALAVMESPSPFDDRASAAHDLDEKSWLYAWALLNGGPL